MTNQIFPRFKNKSRLPNLKNKRIFVGFNSAGVAGLRNITRILKRRGYQIDFYGLEAARFGIDTDYLLKFSRRPIISFFQRIQYFLKILPRYDIWHFNYTKTFFFYPLNLLILKLCGKKIVHTFRGSDARTHLDYLPSKKIINNPQYHWPEWYRGVVNQSWWLKFKIKLRMRIFCWLSDKIVLTGPFLVPSVANFSKIIPYARNISQIPPANDSKKLHQKLIILHVPSIPKMKGTIEVDRIFKILAKKYPQHEFKILGNIPHQELIKEMSLADIIIDQLLMGWYGGQAVEAMALGKTVMSFINPTYLELVPFGREIPIFNTNFWNFKNDLEILINSPDLCQKLSEEGRKFVRKYHAAEKIADQYLEIYQKVV